MKDLHRNVYFVIIAILIVSFLLFPFSITDSGAKYKGETDDFIIEVVDENAIIFNFTNTEQMVEVPVSGYYYISAWGGDGGLGGRGQNGSLQRAEGGKSEEVSGVFYFNKGEKVYIYVGSAGQDAPGGDGTGAGRPGGVNGLGHGNGGSGGAGYKSGSMNGYSGAGAGGGAGTFILKQSGNLNSIVLASGGGGGGGGGSGNVTGTASQGGVGGAGGVEPGSDSTATDGSNGGRAGNNGGQGASSNASTTNGGNGGNGSEASFLSGSGGGAGGGGGGYNFGGNGGSGGASGVGQAARGGGGGRGGQSYYTNSSTDHGHSIPTHSRTSGSNGQVSISMIGK